MRPRWRRAGSPRSASAPSRLWGCDLDPCGPRGNVARTGGGWVSRTTAAVRSRGLKLGWRKSDGRFLSRALRQTLTGYTALAREPLRERQMVVFAGATSSDFPYAALSLRCQDLL